MSQFTAEDSTTQARCSCVTASSLRNNRPGICAVAARGRVSSNPHLLLYFRNVTYSLSIYPFMVEIGKWIGADPQRAGHYFTKRAFRNLCFSDEDSNTRHVVERRTHYVRDIYGYF